MVKDKYFESKQKDLERICSNEVTIFFCTNLFAVAGEDHADYEPLGLLQVVQEGRRVDIDKKAQKWILVYWQMAVETVQQV